MMAVAQTSGMVLVSKVGAGVGVYRITITVTHMDAVEVTAAAAAVIANVIADVAAVVVVAVGGDWNPNHTRQR